jgi:hemerythrin-like domain-containing protein
MTVTTQTPPDLTNYHAVHRALRGGAHQLARAAGALATADDRRRKAYARYWKGYAGEVLAHHTVEDEYFFPALVDRVPVAAQLVRRTDADHRHLDELMDDLTEAVASAAAGNQAPGLVSLTRELADQLQEHLDFEDSEVLPLFVRHFTGPEYHELDEAAVKSLGVGPQAAFTVPFVLGAMTPEEARRTLATAPLPLKVVNALFGGAHRRLVGRAFGATTVEVAR